MAEPVWFWQRIVSPHMAGLAAALAARGRDVTYVAEREMSADRAAQGWTIPSLGTARLRIAPTREAVRAMAGEAPDGSLHICQGLRGNGLVGKAQEALQARGLQQWATMEAVDDSGWSGPLKRQLYRRILTNHREHGGRILAIGHATPRWLAELGMPAERIAPFAYFLPQRPALLPSPTDRDRPFRFVYAGRLVGLKRVDRLIKALARLPAERFELVVIGTGPLEGALRRLAAERLPDRVRWLGRRPMEEIPALLADCDCLVLPSRYDGWGAVVSEALMAGTPAICSNACGVAEIVRGSGVGGVFAAGDIDALGERLRAALVEGRRTPERRPALAAWARGLGAEAGARYLAAVLSSKGPAAPPPPWAGIATVSPQAEAKAA